MRPSRRRFLLRWLTLVGAGLLLVASIRWLGPMLGDVMPALFALAWLAPGPIMAVWGVVVVVRRETCLARGRVIRGRPAIALGCLEIVAGLAFDPLLLSWVRVNYPRDW